MTATVTIEEFGGAWATATVKRDGRALFGVGPYTHLERDAAVETLCYGWPITEAEAARLLDVAEHAAREVTR